MKLSIALFTRNHAHWLPRILPQFQKVADELVVVVNSSTTDNSEEVARAYTDRVFLVPHEVVPERQSERIISFCRGEWILGMLDDETFSPHWEERAYVEELLANRYVTHYWIPRRWLISPGDRFICSSRWYPDFQMRLFRNIPSLFEYPNTLHSSVLVAGEPAYLADSWINHWDLVWRDRAEREAKVAEYRLAAADPLPQYYLYEEQEFETEAIDHNITAKLNDFTVPAIDAADEAYRVVVTPVDLPDRLRAGEEQALTVAVTNQSNRTLHPESRRLKPGKVWVSYHWYATTEAGELGECVAWDNPRYDLPARIPPGATTLGIISVRAPERPGEYYLQLDLVEEGVAWFSQHGASAVQHVTVAKRLPAVEREEVRRCAGNDGE